MPLYGKDCGHAAQAHRRMRQTNSLVYALKNWGGGKLAATTTNIQGSAAEAGEIVRKGVETIKCSSVHITEKLELFGANIGTIAQNRLAKSCKLLVNSYKFAEKREKPALKTLNCAKRKAKTLLILKIRAARGCLSAKAQMPQPHHANAAGLRHLRLSPKTSPLMCENKQKKTVHRREPPKQFRQKRKIL